MTPRKWLGVAFGLVAAFAIFWLGYDVIALIGGRGLERSAITVLALLALMILVGIQVGARIGWDTWAGDHTFPVERWWWAMGIAAVVLFLSVVAF
jgi:hypothetical protein